jgi:hypothetical protein
MTTSRRPSKLNDQLEDRGPFETRRLELMTKLYLAKATAQRTVAANAL